MSSGYRERQLKRRLYDAIYGLAKCFPDFERLCKGGLEYGEHIKTFYDTGNFYFFAQNPLALTAFLSQMSVLIGQMDIDEIPGFPVRVSFNAYDGILNKFRNDEDFYNAKDQYVYEDVVAAVELVANIHKVWSSLALPDEFAMNNISLYGTGSGTKYLDRTSPLLNYIMKYGSGEVYDNHYATLYTRKANGDVTAGTEFEWHDPETSIKPNWQDPEISPLFCHTKRSPLYPLVMMADRKTDDYIFGIITYPSQYLSMSSNVDGVPQEKVMQVESAKLMGKIIQRHISPNKETPFEWEADDRPIYGFRFERLSDIDSFNYMVESRLAGLGK